MNKAQINNENPNTGYPVPFPFIVIVILAVATLIFGWYVLIGAVGIIVILCLGSLIQIAIARFRDREFGTAIVPMEKKDSIRENSYYDSQGHCLKCKAHIFSVEVGQTTTEEIIRFASEAEGWRDNPEAIKGWMPPGVYCPNGCFSIHFTPAPNFPHLNNSGLEFTEKLVEFQDLLAVAYEIRKDRDIYDVQRSLIAYYRRGKKRFMASMAQRHRYTCDICGFNEGEAELHFEDSAIPSNVSLPNQEWWGVVVGMFCDIRRSELHRIVAHNENAPSELLELMSAQAVNNTSRR